MLILILTIVMAGISYFANAGYRNRAIVARLRQGGKVCLLPR
jgi:hypothetical protein